MNSVVEIFSGRFLLRELTEEDISERYLSWLGDAEAKKFITFAAKTKSLSDLKQYVRDRIGRDDILFLGIFEKTTGLHIGNIKYEPVNSYLGYAIMGLLIGDANYHGKSVAVEVLVASAQWLKANRNINQIVLGVGIDNNRAIRAYEKAGFVKTDTDFIQHVLPGAMTMVWKLSGMREFHTNTTDFRA